MQVARTLQPSVRGEGQPRQELPAPDFWTQHRLCDPCAGPRCRAGGGRVGAGGSGPRQIGDASAPR